MRRFPHAFIALAAAPALLAGCAGGSASPSGHPSDNPTPQPSLQRVIAKIGDEVTVASGGKVTAVRYEDPAQTTAPAPAGKRWTAAEIKACAGAEPVEIQPKLFRILFLDRQVIDAAADQLVRTPRLQPTTLAPNACVTGWVSFPIPKQKSPAYVVLTGSTLVGWRLG